MRFSSKSIHIKILFFVGLVIFICLSISTYFTIKIQRKQLVKAKEKELLILTNAIERSLVHAMNRGCSQDVQEIMMMIGEGSDIVRLRIFSPKGTILYSSKTKEVGKRVEDPILSAFRDRKTFVTYRQKTDGMLKLYSVIKPIPNKRTCVKCHNPNIPFAGVLQVGVDLRPLENEISFIYKTIITSFVLTILIIALFGAVLEWRFVKKPLEELLDKMEKAKSGDLTVRVDVKRDDEFGLLGKSFNRMISELAEDKRKIERYHRERLAQAERLATIGEFATGVAHEIRNPLTGISSAIQLLASEFGPNDPKREIIDEILKEIRRLDQLLNDILSYSRPSSLNLISFDIHQVIDDALLFIDSELLQKHKIVKEYTKDLPMVKIDPNQMQQVFYNIILNGLEAMEEGGVLILKTYLKENKVFIEIKDNGCGIPKEQLNRVFRPFFSTKPKGTGLGLAIVQRIVEQHGGGIEIKSELGKGTTFIIYLDAEVLYGERKNTSS